MLFTGPSKRAPTSNRAPEIVYDDAGAVYAASVEQLEPLACGSCGASVPLHEGDVLTCAHCAAKVPVPSAYAALRTSARARDAADHEARAIFARLAGPPPLALRVLAGWFSPGALLLGVYPALFIVGLLLLVGLVAIASRVSATNYFDTTPQTMGAWNGVTVGFALAYVGTILGVYGQRRAVSKHALQEALAARPPTTEGGCFGCRNCGAPLVVASGALGARCDYCSTDNLVIAPPAWVKRVDAHAVALAKAARSARDAEAAEHARARRKLVPYLIGISLASIAFFFAFRATIHDPPPTSDDWPPSFSVYRRLPPQAIEHGYYRHGSQPFLYQGMAARPAASSVVEAAQRPVESATTPNACHDGHCELRYYLPLYRGESFTIVPIGLPEGARFSVMPHVGGAWTADDDYLGSRRDPFGPTVVDRPIANNEPIVVRAERDAWYRVAFTLPSEAERTIRFGIAVERRGSR